MQTSRQWMVTHEWMVKGNRQSEWIDKRGILLWLAEYAGGLGSGAFIVSLFFNNFWGMAAAFLIVAGFKGGLHMFFLGKPMRFWRMVLHPQTSWMSRGLSFVMIFLGCAFLQLIFMVIAPEQTFTIMVLKVLSGLFALCIAFYTGFVFNNTKGVPFWNVPFLPLLFIADGILGGFGLTVAFGIFNPGINLSAAETGSRILLILDIVLVFLYLFLASKKDMVGGRSVLFQIKGQISPIFWFCVVTLGMAVPIIIAVISIFTGELTPVVLICGVICEAVGQLMFKYCFLKSAMYNPILAARS
jgi:formate-dependent nitrite reductase membrane component NrfD